jgi:hypothetical protein
MIDWIYALVETNTGIRWYVGRTIDMERRMYEHRLGAKNYKEGDEHKYLYAHMLDCCNEPWHMEILMVCGPGTEYFEDYFVNKLKLEGEPLQNMKAGDSELWMGRNYSSPEEFVKTRERMIEAEKNKVKREKVYKPTDTNATLYSFENPNKKFESPWMKARTKR